jgi:hypothetical protein
MNSSSAKKFTRGKWAALFLALLIAPEFAVAQTTQKKTTPAPAPTPKAAPAKPAPAPAPGQPPATTQQHPPTPHGSPLGGIGGQHGSENNRPTGSQQPTQNRQPTGTPDQKKIEQKKEDPKKKDDSKKEDSKKDDTNKDANRRDDGRTSPIATEKREVHPNGTSTVTRGDGARVDYDSNGKRTSVTTAGGATGKFDSKGRVSGVNFKSSKGYDTTISHDEHGKQIVTSEHFNQRGERVKTVNLGPHKGYVDTISTRHGVEFTRRTTVVDGHTSVAVYRDYYYNGRVYYGHVPGYYYAPRFYAWAYAPWGAPVAFAWGWGPWYGAYGYYFAPYPAYAGPAFWLTDYVVAENLQAAYESHGAEVTTSNNQQEGAGLAYAPVLSAGATATFTFSVPAGQVETVAYRIPTGGYLDSVPFEVSVNGVTVATVDKDPNYKWGDIAPIQRQLWSKSFDPGDYVLTIRSGGGFVNFYGLWLGRAPSDQAPMTGNDGNQSASVTPEIKTAITDEVKADLASEQAVSTAPPTQSGASPTSDVPAALDPKQRTFVVSTAISEKTTDGSQCSLSAGDILTRIDNTPDTNQNVTSMVTSSQKSDCPSGTMVAISIQDLQDMHNAFVEKMDAGLKQLASTQGTKGIPSSPAPGQRPNPDGQAQPDTTASSDLQQQQKDADSAEKDVNQAVAPGQGN